MRAKFVRRRDGMMRADLHIDVPVEYGEVSKLATRLGVSVDVVMRRLREAVESEVSGMITQWHSTWVNDEGKVALVHYDEIGDDVGESSLKVDRSETFDVFK